MRFHLIAVLALMLFSSDPLAAQARDRSIAKDAARPAARWCRIVIDGVPAAQQPGPMDCATAVRRRPANARVIFDRDNGDRRARSDDRSTRRRRNNDADSDSDSDSDSDADSDSDSDSEDSDRRSRGRRDSARDRDQDTCVDVDRDRRCDYYPVGRDRADRSRSRRRTETCVDRNRDGRCDDRTTNPRRIPPSLPEVLGTIMRGQ